MACFIDDNSVNYNDFTGSNSEKAFETGYHDETRTLPQCNKQNYNGTPSFTCSGNGEEFTVTGCTENLGVIPNETAEQGSDGHKAFHEIALSGTELEEWQNQWRKFAYNIFFKSKQKE